MKKEPLSIMIVKTLLAVIIFTGVGTIIIGGALLIGRQGKVLNNDPVKLIGGEVNIKGTVSKIKEYSISTTCIDIDISEIERKISKPKIINRGKEIQGEKICSYTFSYDVNDSYYVGEIDGKKIRMLAETGLLDECYNKSEFYNTQLGCQIYLKPKKIEILEGEIKKEVTIITDKTEYEQGETVEITVKNNLDKSIWHKGSLHNICENAFYIGVKEENYKEFHSFSSAYCPGDLGELKQYSNITDQLDPKEDLVLLIANENIQFPATYKLRFKYYNKNIDSNSAGLEIHSNEFTIKEKSALDMRCSEKVKIVGNCEADFSAGGYEFDYSTGKCVRKIVTGSGCLAKIPFKSLEECQEVCEKKEDVALPDENELIKCESDSDCVLVDPGKCDCNNCKTKAINKKYLDAWSKAYMKQECHLEMICSAKALICIPYETKCDNSKCIAIRESFTKPN